MYRFYEKLTKYGGGGKFAMYLEMPLKAKVLKGACKRFYGNFVAVLLSDLLGR